VLNVYNPCLLNLVWPTTALIFETLTRLKVQSEALAEVSLAFFESLGVHVYMCKRGKNPCTKTDMIVAERHTATLV
jgi:hypothetical protein